ncbi:MAG: hypothetical protein O7B99_09220 [Planctomycetota bacterium]|nr:hypothetical protein [Planctomycetota bacterium]
MRWSVLGTQFCLEIAFGVLLALAFVPKAPVGTLFYRVMGTAAFLPILIALIAPVWTGLASWNDPAVLATSIAALAYPIYSGPFRGRRWAIGLGLALVGCGAAVVFSLQASTLVDGAGPLLLAGLSALSTGAVAGSVGLAMVLGHWYLTVPNLQVRHLRRLNRVTVVTMLVSLLLVGLTCLTFGDPLNDGEQPLFGATGLMFLGTRVTVGLVMPLAFAGMTAGSLKYSNTRSATGILYASTVLVLIGAAVSISLQDHYGIPL